MKRKLLAMLLSLAMLFTLMPPGVAMAADENTITVGGETLTGSSTQPAYATTDEDGELTQSNESNYDIKWDGETLTLQNATIKSSDVNNQGAPQKACVFALHSYQVKLIGENKLIGANVQNQGFAYTYGFYATTTTSCGSADITISGDGSLEYEGTSVSAKATAPDSSISGDRRVIHAAIYADNGSVYIQGGALTLTAGAAETIMYP